jgi:hypothetical protein
LPRPLRAWLLERKTRVDDAALAQLSATVATSPEEALAAASIVHDAYVDRGIAPPHASRVRVSPYQVLPQSFVIVAKRGSSVVGTITLQTESELGLPLLEERAFRDHVAALRARGRVVAEVGALAVLPPDRGTGVVHLINRAMIDVARAVGVDDLVMVVSDWAAPLYETTLCFDTFAKAPTYPGLARLTPCAALHLPLDDAERRFEHRAPRSHALYVRRPWPEVELPPLSRVVHGEGRLAAARALVAARRDVFLRLDRSHVLTLRRLVPDIYWPTPSQLDPRELAELGIGEVAAA